MKLITWYNLMKARRDLTPSREFKHALWKKLESQPGFQSGLAWYHLYYVKTAGLVAGVVGLTFVGTSVYAYNSASVTAGTPLYPIKVGLENIEEQTKLTPEDKARFLLKKMERREEEKKVIVQRQKITFVSNPIAVNTSTTSSPEITPQVVSDAISQTNQEIADAEKKLGELQAQLQGSDKQLRNFIENKIKQNRGRGQGKNRGTDSSGSNVDDSNTSTTSTENSSVQTTTTATTSTTTSSSSSTPTTTPSTSTTIVSSTNASSLRRRRGNNRGFKSFDVSSSTVTNENVTTTAAIKNQGKIKARRRNQNNYGSVSSTLLESGASVQSSRLKFY